MPAEARVTTTWKKQKVFVAFFLFALASYFLWDGAVGYPRANARYAEWKRYYDEGRLAEWPAVAASKGWKADEWQKWLDDPHQHGQTPAVRWAPGKITEQYVCAGVVGAMGLGVLVYWLMRKGRTVRTDAVAVYSPAGVRIPFSAITGLGKKKWETKGLATVRYELNGEAGKFVLDDYKFDHEPIHQIAQEIEDHLIKRAS